MKIAGKPVRDARKPLVLHIKDDDVKKSDKKKPENCAAAVACKRQEHVKDVRVHLSHTYVDRGAYWERYSTPSRMRTEIVSFDRGAAFEPGDYKLNVTKQSHKLGADRRKRPTPKQNKNGKREFHRVSGVRASAFKNLWSK